MAYVLLDLDAVFDNAEYCLRVPYYFEELDDGRARFILIAGSLSWKGIVDKVQAKQIKARIETGNAESLRTLGRRRFIEFKDWESFEKLVAW